MYKSVGFFCLLLALSFSQGFPHESKAVRTRGDLNLMLDDIRFPPNFDHKSGIVGDEYRWPQNELVYTMDTAFSASERDTILAGMADISSKTCITFRERTNQRDYVTIVRGSPNSGCWSYVGRLGGRQELNLQAPEFAGAPHCIWVGTAAHELIHAIGFYHEQSRPDRDDYVTINWGNIQPGTEYNFDKYNEGEVDTQGVPYDYSSIMHYDAYAFAVDTSQPTIIPHQTGVSLGGDDVTGYDSQKINNMYKC